MKYVIIPVQSDYISELLLSLHEQDNITVFDNEKFVESQIILREQDKIYLSSDTIYPLVEHHFDKARAELISTFRDKYQFRQKLKKIFPDFFFEKIDLKKLAQYNFNFDEAQQYIVKPLAGFMGGGVRIINQDTDLISLSKDIKHELLKFSELYPNIFSETLIVEKYIGGDEEYAVDMFYDEKGKPVIISLYGHPAAKRKEYLQMLYYTNEALFEKFQKQLIQFFSQFNDILRVKSFPIHAEFKVDETNQLIPIEFNASRFGGMGLTDLTYYAFNFHPIKAYFDDYHPDWETLWKAQDNQHFYWVLGYNGADVDIKKCQPDHNKFKSLLPANSKLLAYKSLDHQKNPAFAIAYLSTKDREDLNRVLNIEFNECFSESS